MPTRAIFNDDKNIRPSLPSYKRAFAVSTHNWEHSHSKESYSSLRKEKNGKMNITQSRVYILANQVLIIQEILNQNSTC